MTDVLSKPVLILNRVFAPVQLTTAKRAFVLLYGGAARALDEAGEEYDFDLWRTLPVRDDDDALPDRRRRAPRAARAPPRSLRPHAAGHGASHAPQPDVPRRSISASTAGSSRRSAS